MRDPMRSEIPFVYRYFRRKGFGRRMSLAMALYCCDPTTSIYPQRMQ